MFNNPDASAHRPQKQRWLESGCAITICLPWSELYFLSWSTLGIEWQGLMCIDKFYSISKDGRSTRLDILRAQGQVWRYWILKIANHIIHSMWSVNWSVSCRKKGTAVSASQGLIFFPFILAGLLQVACGLSSMDAHEPIVSDKRRVHIRDGLGGFMVRCMVNHERCGSNIRARFTMPTT